MITFLCGILILVVGYLFYSPYVVKIFSPDDRDVPSKTMYDGVDRLPMSKNRNSLIHLLNIAGTGPIIGAIQGILFGPVAFILIPLGCIFAGAVHDYFAGMLSVRNSAMQIPGIIKKYTTKTEYCIFLVIVCIMLLLVTTVFVYTSGDIFTGRFFNLKEFPLTNPVVLTSYIVIFVYFMIAALFPIDKIIGRFYPVLGILLLTGTFLIAAGFFIKGIHLQEIDITRLNLHPDKLPLIPMFFMTVSCGLLSGFHSTQATIIAGTVSNEYDGKRIFYGMMCVESLIAMIWAAAAADLYFLNEVPSSLIGTVSVVNIAADKFVPFNLGFLVTAAVVILPVTSGDTALRGLRITLSDSLGLKQQTPASRLLIIIPLVICIAGILAVAKSYASGFAGIWRYFIFFNQLIAIPVLFCACIYLAQNKKNYFVALIPGLFYVFITASFIFNSAIGFGLSYKHSVASGLIVTFVSILYLRKKLK